MRTIPSATKAALLEKTVARAYLARFDFPSGVVAVHGGTGSFTFGGDTYVGLGRFAGGISSVQESGDARPRGVTFLLTGVDVGLIEKAQEDNFVGRDADLFVLCYEPDTYEPIGNPWNIWSGVMDTMRYRIAEGAFDLELTCESRLIKLSRRNARRRTDADQQRRFPGDRFFEFVDQLRWHRVQVGGTVGGVGGPPGARPPRDPGNRAKIP